MANEVRFDGRVAVVTGAGGGLGRSHALLLGARGAKVVVNDLGGGMHGGGKSSAAADKVVAEIKEAGGEAVANYDSVEDGDKIIQSALDAFGRIDIVINNAGILRDVSFHKMSQDDWDLIYKVHVLGSYRVTHAAWNHLRDQGYGRIVFTASAAGIYGNFGQANYSTAKLGLLGLSNTLAIEGLKKGIKVNTIAPIAGSRLTETVLPKELIEQLKPEYVSPFVAYLCSEECEETGGLFEVGGGFFAKLRWQRAEGKFFPMGKPMTPETVRGAWKDIAGFDKVSYPADIGASMQPIIANLGKKSKGGNQYIDVDLALGAELPEATTEYGPREVSLYALGVGAAKDPLDPKELNLVYEMSGEGFHVLPTFGVVPALGAVIKLAAEGRQAPGLNYGFERVLHGEQYTEIKRPLPTSAKLRHKAYIKDIFDKGKNALVITAITSYDENGDELVYNELTTFVRGAGGWGGERGPSAEVNVPPERAPDAVVEEKTDPNQALLYRLSGDINPLHADPSFARGFGFDKPILHGLCTFGFAGRHIIKAFAGGDPRKFKSIKVRFAESVFPGETLITEMWKESGTRIVFRTRVKERDKVVISNAAVELYTEIPKPKAKAAPAASAPAASAAPTSADLFNAVNAYLQQNPAVAERVQTVFQWKLSAPESEWVIDAKNGKGSCAPGRADKPDVTFEIADADFMAMATGQADPQKLYFAGKMKLSGNLMAAQKLDFLKKIDPALVLEQMKKRGAGTPGAEGAAPAAAPAQVESAHIFFAIGHHLEKNPELAGKVQTVFQWKLTNPDAQWIVDAKNGKGSCTPGVADKPDVTLELSDADFLAMATGQADPQKLYFGGKLKISGNVMAAQKLDFLKKIDREAAMKAFAERQQKGGAQAAPAAAPKAQKAAQSDAIFRALGERLQKNPNLHGEIGKLLQFNVKSPERSFLVDLAAGPGTVKEGVSDRAAAVLTIDDDDLVALVKGQATAKDLFQRGKLRIDGDASVGQKLGLLNNLV
jgi:3-hydroxyacyl-CoA dehydrogenase/3a,7a,12a-trihydroxy-5b-cholest-24-enoyl-CoA hydratase